MCLYSKSCRLAPSTHWRNACGRRPYARGEAVCRKGDPGTNLYVITLGQVKLSLIAENGREAILDLLGPGDVFGELALLDGEPRSADAIATEASHVLLLDRDEFHRCVRQQPEIAVHLLAVLSQRIRRDTRLMEEAAFLDVPRRLCGTLLRLARSGESRAAHATEAHELVTPRLVQSDLAAMAGTTRETLSKWLGVLEDELLIRRMPQGRILVLQPDELRRRYSVTRG